MSTTADKTSEPAVSSASNRCQQTHAEQALETLLPLAKEFQDTFVAAMQNKVTGYCILRVEYDRGRLTQMFLDQRKQAKPKDRNA